MEYCNAASKKRSRLFNAFVELLPYCAKIESQGKRFEGFKVVYP